jgi:hypothetical protein
MAADNFLASILGDGAPINIPSGFAQSMMPGPVTDPIKQRRPRLSALDIIGGLSDAVAEMGGAGAGYQPGLDARASRERSIVEQQQKDQLFQQQLAQNQQKFQMNDDASAEVQRGRLGDALAAVSSSENPLETWTSVADATGLPPEKAQMVTAALTKNPGMAAQLATAFGYTPPAAGSAPREVQLYQLAKKENPELKFQDFLTSIAEKPLTEYQRGQLGLREKQIGNTYEVQRERNDINRQRATASGNATDGVEMTKTQRGNVNMKIRTLPNIERQLSEVERLASGLDDINSGIVGGRIPGSLNAAANAYDKAVANLRTQIRQLTRTPGEGSISNWEGQLNEMTLPSRTDRPEGRAQAIRDMRALVQGIRTGYQEMIGSPAPAARGGGRRPPPPRNRGNGGGSAGGWKVIGVK